MKIIMKMKTYYIFLMSAIYLLAGCSSAALLDFSSPEKSYETLHHAISINDMDLYSKCFLKPEDQEMAKQLQSLGGFSQAVKFVRHEVLDRGIINESEVNLRVREVGERTSSAGEVSYHFISTVLVNYRKTSNGWKVHSYTTERVNKAEKVGDKYVPTEQKQESEVTSQ
jgi:hypothetical protein